jgi:hypothetical protein
MAAAVRPNDFDAAFSHLARDFQYGTANRAEFRRLAESAARNRRVTELVVWDQQVTAVDKERGRADVSFQFKVRGEGAGFGEGFFLCKSTWVREPDGRWRMQTFRVYPLNAADQPIVIPGVG